MVSDGTEICQVFLQEYENPLQTPLADSLTIMDTAVFIRMEN